MTWDISDLRISFAFFETALVDDPGTTDISVSAKGSACLTVKIIVDIIQNEIDDQ
jgi:hypothetical protein